MSRTSNSIFKTGKDLEALGITNCKAIFHNLETNLLIDIAIRKEGATLASNGAIVIKTGKFTGRSPKDRYIVRDTITADKVWWGDINKEFDSIKFDKLYDKVTDHLSEKKLYVRDAFAGASVSNRLSVRVVGEHAWHNLFCKNMFIEPTKEELDVFKTDFTVITAPDFKATPTIDGTESTNFVIINFSRKLVLIGGTGYTGETKKGIFSVLNFLLPQKHNVLSMHCSANKGEDGDTAIFFGLSGTGKTTLSADPGRWLIGDDEHGWTADGIYNFEGGCYAKVINLSIESEPTIFKAIRHGALVENTQYIKGTKEIDFSNTDISQNTRVSYPLKHVDKICSPSIGIHPKNIFFLTCDAFGVLPPISKLSSAQAMYHFMSGYTAKVAGTEMGVKEPQAVFSACFGAPFMPLHPIEYADLLGQKMIDHETNVWLVNTGWTGGGFGIGKRIALQYTRELVNQALSGGLDDVNFETHNIFKIEMPQSCNNVPSEILNPKSTWEDPLLYDQAANQLAKLFSKNFKQFESHCSAEILFASPIIVKAPRVEKA